MTTLKIRLIHWKAEEAREKANLLQTLHSGEPATGCFVDAEPISHDALLKLRQNPPDVLIIDLTRLPSQGRDIALNVRQFKAMRTVPILFAGGDPVKVVRRDGIEPPSCRCLRPALLLSYPRIESLDVFHF